MRSPRLPLEVPIPDEIRPALDAWLEYKTKRRQTYKTAEGLADLVERMVAMGPERAMAAVKWSRSNNWAGLFEEKKNGKAGGSAPPAWAAELMTPSEIAAWELRWERHERSCFLENLSITADRRRLALTEEES